MRRHSSARSLLVAGLVVAGALIAPKAVDARGPDGERALLNRIPVGQRGLVNESVRPEGITVERALLGRVSGRTATAGRTDKGETQVDGERALLGR